jgi:hypothetical protein
MTRAKFRQVDVTRALRAAKAAGLNVSRCEIDKEGRITLFSDVAREATSAPKLTAYAKWKAEQE